VALGEAESHIAAAKALLAEGKTAEARAELGLAKGALEQVYAAVRSHASNGKGPLGFFEHGEKKMEKFENKGNKSSGSNKGGNGNGKGKKD
jgi:hypothetical protein